MPEIDLSELLTADQAAAYLGVTRQRVYTLAWSGTLGQRVGSTWLFTRHELDDWKAQPKSKGGRPKSDAPLPTLVVGATNS